MIFHPLTDCSCVHFLGFEQFDRGMDSFYIREGDWCIRSLLWQVAIASWLILQYRFNHNYPNVQTRTGARMLLYDRL
jgi:hypothetical protein